MKKKNQQHYLNYWLDATQVARTDLCEDRSKQSNKLFHSVANAFTRKQQKEYEQAQKK